MAQMMILNPRKRGAKARKASPKQVAARKRFAAMAKARAKAARAKLNPTRKRRAKRRALVKLNPGAPMARKSKRSSARRRLSPLRLFRRKARRNPIMPSGFVNSHVKPAAIGAAGALVNDIAVGALVKRLPAAMQKPEIRHIVKAVAAVGLGVLASKGRVASSGVIKAATVGALTCVMHDAARAQVQKVLPTVALGEYLSEVIGPYDGGNMLNEYVDEYPGEFVDSDAFEVESDDLVIG